jgi:hypothetical protein
MGLLAGCAASTDTDSAVELLTEGSVAIAFELDADFVDNIEANGEQPAGRFYGSIYLDSDVTGLGPIEGAEALIDLELEVDLASANPTAELMTSETLPAEIVVILGFLDTDGNAVAGALDPDSGDPVTLVGENKFQVEPGDPTSVTVYFGFLYP